MKRLTVRITGTVQGVGFRASTRRQAQSLGVTGWVRNERDGSVTVTAEGSEDDLKALLDFLHEGPRSARVRQVDSDWEDAEGTFDKFTIETV